MALIRVRYALFNAERGGATHGTHYPYDTHVPLIFFGAAFRPGTYRRQVSTTDLAPTLAAALGLTPPTLATGRVLARALRSNTAAEGDSK
jgi:arylsulfatase A-like enzyme